MICDNPEVLAIVEQADRDWNKDQVDILFPPWLLPEKNQWAKAEIDRITFTWSNIREKPSEENTECKADYTVETINLLTGEPLTGHSAVNYSVNAFNEVKFLGEDIK